MKADLEQLEKMQEDLFRQQCDLDIQKAMVKHFLKKKRAEQLTLNDVVKPFFCADEKQNGIDQRCEKQCNSGCTKLPSKQKSCVNGVDSDTCRYNGICDYC